MNLEGIVSKRLGSLYHFGLSRRGGRSSALNTSSPDLLVGASSEFLKDPAFRSAL